MSEQEKIRRYAHNTKIKEYDRYRYCMRLDELRALYEYSKDDVCGALCLAFDFGMAKGYRAAKAAAKK